MSLFTMTDGDIIHQYKKDQIRKKTTPTAFLVLCDQAAYVSLPSGKKPHKSPLVHVSQMKMSALTSGKYRLLMRFSL